MKRLSVSILVLLLLVVLWLAISISPYVASPHRELNQVRVHHTALIMMDMWGYIPHLNENIDKINAMLIAYRDAGGQIFQSNNTAPISPKVNVADSDIILYGGESGVNRLLADLQIIGIDRLYFAGYYTDVCVMIRETGIQALAANGYRDIWIISDVTDTVDHADLPAQIKLIESNYGGSTTMGELLQELKHE